MLSPKHKTPLLVFLVLLFVALLGLTIWTSESDINGLVSGVPRTVQRPSGFFRRGDRDAETGIPTWKRNMRIAGSVITIIAVALAALVFVTPLKPAARTGANGGITLILIIGVVIIAIAAWFDTNQEHDAISCNSDSRQSRACESKEDLYTAVVVFSWLATVIGIVTAVLLLAYSRSGDWTKAHDAKLLAYGQPGQLQPGMYPNGISFVRKWILSLALLFTFIFAALVLLGTIILHEYRETIILRNADGRALDANGESTRPGWPKENTILRYFLCGGAILVLLANLVPIRSMTLHYVFSFLYFALAILALVAFIKDIQAINDSSDIQCPTDLDCEHHRFNAIAALEFIGFFFLLILICMKCAGHYKKKAPVAAPEPQTQIVHVPVPVAVPTAVPTVQSASFVQAAPSYVQAAPAQIAYNPFQSTDAIVV